MVGPSPEKDTRKPHTPNLEDILNRGRDQFQGEWYNKKEFKALWILLAWVGTIGAFVLMIVLALAVNILFFLIPAVIIGLVLTYFGILETL